MFDYLKATSFKKTVKGVESIIATLPGNVNEAYKQILTKSKEQGMVRKALSIILAASRPLTISEMNIALNVDNTLKRIQDLDLEKNEDSRERLRTSCGLFISIHHEKVYFLHQTAREFLLADALSTVSDSSGPVWQHSITSQSAHIVLAEINVIYLDSLNQDDSLQKLKTDDKSESDDEWESGDEWESDDEWERYDELESHDALESDNALESDDELESECEEGDSSVDLHAFLGYAANNWGMHAEAARISVGSGLIALILSICSPDSSVSSIWYAIYRQTKYEVSNGGFHALLITSCFGIEEAVKLQLEKGATLDFEDKDGRTPLSYAAENGHEAIVKLLLEKGATLDFEDKHGRTPLSRAVRNGHEVIVKLLFEKGATFDFKDKDGRTPLSYAAENGHEAIVKLLLEKGAIIDSEDKDGWTPLSYAEENWHETIVKLLLEKGAAFNSEHALE